jgi:hypothetical protein
MKCTTRIGLLTMMVLSLAFPHISGAQAHFLRGVKYLHSFGFEEAVEAFQRPMP